MYRNDWIPASAGMTNQDQVAEKGITGVIASKAKQSRFLIKPNYKIASFRLRRTSGGLLAMTHC